MVGAGTLRVFVGSVTSTLVIFFLLLLLFLFLGLFLFLFLGFCLFFFLSSFLYLFLCFFHLTCASLRCSFFCRYVGRVFAMLGCPSFPRRGCPTLVCAGHAGCNSGSLDQSAKYVG